MNKRSLIEFEENMKSQFTIRNSDCEDEFAVKLPAPVWEFESKVKENQGLFPAHCFIKVVVDDIAWAELGAYVRTFTEEKAIERGCIRGIKREELHLSLSKNFFLQLHEIKPFLNLFHSLLEDVSAFKLSFEEAKAFSGDNGTNTYLSLLCVRNKRRVVEFINRIDKAVTAFKGKPFYSPAEPHLSFASLDQELLKDKEEILPFLSVLDQDVNEVLVRIGNKLYSHTLR